MPGTATTSHSMLDAIGNTPLVKLAKQADSGQSVSAGHALLDELADLAAAARSHLRRAAA